MRDQRNAWSCGARVEGLNGENAALGVHFPHTGHCGYVTQGADWAQALPGNYNKCLYTQPGRNLGDGPEGGRWPVEAYLKDGDLSPLPICAFLSGILVISIHM